MKEMMKGGCCAHLCIGIVVLLAGVLFLFKDLNVANYTFGIQPWTFVLLLVGVKMAIMGFKK